MGRATAGGAWPLVGRWTRRSGAGTGRRRLGAVSTIAVVALLAACGGGSSDDSSSADDSPGTAASDTGGSDSVAVSADEAADELEPDDFADVDSVDRRPALLSELGEPDACVITVDEVDGELSRFESWSYYEAGSQIDLVDGEVLWDVEIDDVPDGSLYPLVVSPMDFTMLASADETLAGLEDLELVKLDGAADEFEVDGAELWAGEQLALAFVDDALIYVEAYPLAAGAQEEGS